MWNDETSQSHVAGILDESPVTAVPSSVDGLNGRIAMSKNDRQGITLLELLIVISIIGVLLQLLLPAIEASREAARRSVCQNNLRQIGMAMLNHESSQHFLPTAGWGWAWMGDPDRGVGKEQSGSWCYQLLPYLEGRDIHDIGKGTRNDAKYDALTVMAALPSPLLYCPSRRLPRPTPNRYGPVKNKEFNLGNLFWYNAKKAEVLARTDYAANVGDLWVWWNEGPPPAKADAGEGFLKFHGINRASVDPAEVSGVVMQRQPIYFRQITDGASKTYFAGEKSMAASDYKTGRGLNDDQSSWNGDDWDLQCSTQFRPREDPDSPTGLSIGFGSAHPGVCGMVYCDGSVQLVSYEIDPAIHRQAGNRHDGELSASTSQH
jgi:prepilin-type N-terminal cleavage/methylation domain-containing protein